jgi:uncharacterized protein (TIGR00251 family)
VRLVLELRQTSAGCTFKVRLTPRAASAAIGGEHAGALKVSVTAPPSDGAANEALIELLAEALALPKSALEITHGHTSRRKTLRVRGATPDAILALAAACKR